MRVNPVRSSGSATRRRLVRLSVRAATSGRPYRFGLWLTQIPCHGSQGTHSDPSKVPLYQQHTGEGKMDSQGKIQMGSLPFDDDGSRIRELDGNKEKSVSRGSSEEKQNKENGGNLGENNDENNKYSKFALNQQEMISEETPAAIQNLTSANSEDNIAALEERLQLLQQLELIAHSRWPYRSDSTLSQNARKNTNMELYFTDAINEYFKRSRDGETEKNLGQGYVPHALPSRQQAELSKKPLVPQETRADEVKRFQDRTKHQFPELPQWLQLRQSWNDGEARGGRSRVVRGSRYNQLRSRLAALRGELCTVKLTPLVVHTGIV